MSTPSKELLEIAKVLDSLKSEFESTKVKEPLQRLQDASNKIGKSWGGSWLDYHARIYYRDFQVPPAGARFSQEWGFIRFGDTRGDWVEYSFDDVQGMVFRTAGNPDLKLAKALAEKANEVIDDKRSEIDSILTTVLARRNDPFLENLKKTLDTVKSIDESDVVEYAMPKGQLISRDTSAIGQGFQTPPHIAVMAETVALQSPAEASARLSKIAKQAASHLSKRTPIEISTPIISPSESLATSTELTFPDKVTISWLYHHVPVPVWVTLGGLIVAAFIGGVTFAQTTLVRELFGKATSSTTQSERPSLSSEDLKAKTDQLIQGHNESVKQIYEAIAYEEKGSGSAVYSWDHQRHLDAANRLRATLKQENERFENQLNALKELSTAK